MSRYTRNQVYDSEGRMRKFDLWALYLIIASRSDGKVSVKIGMSETPYKRFVGLLTGIPFPCEMFFMWYGGRRDTRQFETHLHGVYREFHTHGEWFEFDMSRQNIFQSISAEYMRERGRLPDWKRITEQQALAFAGKSNRAA